MWFQKLFGRGDRVDPRPLAVPAGMKLPETAEQKMQRMIRGELSRAASENGYETFEEANDFDVGDDDPTLTPTSHEMASEFMEGLRNGEYEGPGFGGESERKRERSGDERRRRERSEEGRSVDDERAGSRRRDEEDEEQRAPRNARSSFRDGVEDDDRPGVRRDARRADRDGYRSRRDRDED